MKRLALILIVIAMTVVFVGYQWEPECRWEAGMVIAELDYDSDLGGAIRKFVFPGNWQPLHQTAWKDTKGNYYWWAKRRVCE